MLLSGSEKLESTVQKESDMLAQSRDHRPDTWAEDAAGKQTPARGSEHQRAAGVSALSSLFPLILSLPLSPKQSSLPPSALFFFSSHLFLSAALIDLRRRRQNGFFNFTDV